MRLSQAPDTNSGTGQHCTTCTLCISVVGAGYLAGDLSPSSSLLPGLGYYCFFPTPFNPHRQRLHTASPPPADSLPPRAETRLTTRGSPAPAAGAAGTGGGAHDHAHYPSFYWLDEAQLTAYWAVDDVNHHRAVTRCSDYPRRKLFSHSRRRGGEETTRSCLCSAVLTPPYTVLCGRSDCVCTYML